VVLTQVVHFATVRVMALRSFSGDRWRYRVIGKYELWFNDDKDDAAIADTAARTYAQSGYHGAVMKIIEMNSAFRSFMTVTSRLKPEWRENIGPGALRATAVSRKHPRGLGIFASRVDRFDLHRFRLLLLRGGRAQLRIHGLLQT